MHLRFSRSNNHNNHNNKSMFCFIDANKATLRIDIFLEVLVIAKEIITIYSFESYIDHKYFFSYLTSKSAKVILIIKHFNHFFTLKKH